MKYILFILIIFSFSSFAENNLIKENNSKPCHISNFELNNLDIPKKTILDTYENFKECIQYIEYKDIDNDNLKELILNTTMTAGTGMSLQLIHFVDYYNKKLVDIEIPFRYTETERAYFLFPYEKAIEMRDKFEKENKWYEYFIDETTELLIINENQTDVYINRNISFDNPLIFQDFIELYPIYKEGSCKYYFGKLVTNQKIEFINLSEEKKCSIK